MNSYYVRLHGGLAGWNAFAARVSRLDHSALLGGSSGGGGGAGLQIAAASAERGTQLAVVALLLFGALAALVTVLLAGQALARQVLLDEADLAILTGLGMSRAQIVAVAVLRAALAGMAGGVLAVAVAVAASPLMPVGLARQAEISPGISADALVLAAGFCAIVVLMAALGALSAWGVSRRGPGRGEAARRAGGPRLAGLLARSPLPLTTVLGVRFGLTRGRGRTAVPVGTALAGAATAVLAVAAALTFGASVDQLVNSPRQQGWNWDVLVGNPNAETDPAGQIVPRLAADPQAGAYSAMTDLQGGATVDGAAVGTTFVFDPLKGAVFPPLLEGRPTPDNGGDRARRQHAAPDRPAGGPDGQARDTCGHDHHAGRRPDDRPVGRGRPHQRAGSGGLGVGQLLPVDQRQSGPPPPGQRAAAVLPAVRRPLCPRRAASGGVRPPAARLRPHRVAAAPRRERRQPAKRSTAFRWCWPDWPPSSAPLPSATR